MGKGNQNTGATTKAAKTAKKIAKTNRKGKHQARTHKVYEKVRFYRPRTLALRRNPKYQRNSSNLNPIKLGFDKYSVIRNPVNTEQAMKKVEDENTMVFIVDHQATKPKIRDAFQQIYNVKVRSVNTLNRPDGKKKAYIRLAQDQDALNLANKIGLI
mmetsp:Transcript_11735/g.10191  ORF Transcript_11735/g.10191 Transcript_11735/m.10191 type:complete len:157 (+) Transcript_11735:83-553(+)